MLSTPALPRFGNNLLKDAKWLFAVPILLWLAGCSEHITEAPEEAKNDTLIICPVSTLNFPIEYPVAAFETMINEKLQGAFLKKWIRPEKGIDSVYVELRRNGKVRLSKSGKTLNAVFPLSVKANYMKKVAGVTIQNQTPVNASLVLYLSIHLGLKQDWNLDPTTTIKKIEWKEEPQIKIGVVNINLKPILNKAITGNEDKLGNVIDQALSNTVKTRKTIEKIWNDLQKPITINRKKVNVKLIIRPEDLSCRLDAGNQDTMLLHMMVKAQLSTIYPGMEIPKKNTALPPLKKITNSSDSLDIYLYSRIKYDMLNKILNEEMGSVKIEKPGFTTTIKKVKLYTSGQQVAVAATIKGDIDGTLYATGDLVFVDSLKEIRIQHLTYTLDSENIVANSADWFLHDDLLEKLEKQLIYKPGDFLQKVPELITEAIEKGKSGKKINVVFSRLDIKPQQIVLDKSGFHFIIHAKGQGGIELERAVFEKKKK